MVNNWSNEATWRTVCWLSSYRYSRLMMASREIWGESDGQPSVALERFAAHLQNVLAEAKLSGEFPGVCADDVDVIQIADSWLDGMAVYHAVRLRLPK